MLLNFGAANHRSLREEQALQLQPVYEADRPAGTHWEAVPVVGIFGANAAGKSNLLDALEYMARMVVHSHRDAEPDGGVLRHPFRLDEAALSEPSWFVVDLLLEGVRYTYGFSVDDEQVIDEWLHSYPQGKKRKIFERSAADVEPGDSQSRRELKLVESITEPNVLFMSMAARSGQPDFRPVYDWFAQGLRFRKLSFPGRAGLFGPALMRVLDAPAPELMSLLRAADLGIEDCGTERTLLNEEELRERGLSGLHGNGPYELKRPWIGHRGRSPSSVRAAPSPSMNSTPARIPSSPHSSSGSSRTPPPIRTAPSCSSPLTTRACSAVWAGRTFSSAIRSGSWTRTSTERQNCSLSPSSSHARRRTASAATSAAVTAACRSSTTASPRLWRRGAITRMARTPKARK